MSSDEEHEDYEPEPVKCSDCGEYEYWCEYCGYHAHDCQPGNPLSKPR